MAKNSSNKYPADKSGTKYSEFRNTKRVPTSKTRTDTTKQAGTADQDSARAGTPA